MDSFDILMEFPRPSQVTLIAPDLTAFVKLQFVMTSVEPTVKFHAIPSTAKSVTVQSFTIISSAYMSTRVICCAVESGKWQLITWH